MIALPSIIEADFAVSGQVTLKAQPDVAVGAGDFEQMESRVDNQLVYDIDLSLMTNTAAAQGLASFHDVDCRQGLAYWTTDALERHFGYEGSRTAFCFRAAPEFRPRGRGWQEVKLSLTGQVADTLQSIYSIAWPDVACPKKDGVVASYSKSLGQFQSSANTVQRWRKSLANSYLLEVASVFSIGDLPVWHGFYACVRTNIWITPTWLANSFLRGRAGAVEARFFEPPLLTVDGDHVSVAAKLQVRYV